MTSFMRSCESCVETEDFLRGLVVTRSCDRVTTGHSIVGTSGRGGCNDYTGKTKSELRWFLAMDSLTTCDEILRSGVKPGSSS